MRFLDFKGIFRNLSTEQVKLVRVKGSKVFRLAAKELAVQPGDLCRQLLNTFLKGTELLSLSLIGRGQGGYSGIQCLYWLQ